MVDVTGEVRPASGPLRSTLQQFISQLGKPWPQACVDREPFVSVCQISGHFLAQARIGLAHLTAPVPILDQLLGAKRDQDADDDDPDFAGELAPAV